MSKVKLMPHQVEALAASEGKDSVLFALDMGRPTWTRENFFGL